MFDECVSNGALLAQQKKRTLLLSQLENEERTIMNLQQSGCELLKARLAEVGITATNQTGVMEKANEIVAKYKELQHQHAVVQQHVSYLEAVSGHLMKAYADQGVKKSTAKKSNAKKAALQDINHITASYFDHNKPLGYVNNTPQRQVLNDASFPDKQLQPANVNPSAATLSNGSSHHLNKMAPPVTDTFQIPNANDRINSMIVAALNDKSDRSSSSPSVKSETTKPKKEKEPKRRSQKSKAKDSAVDDKELNKYMISPRHKPDDHEPRFTETFSIKPANKTPPQTHNSPDPEKKPLTLTLVIDRRDNSASVKSPSKSSPSKSPEKSPKHEAKRKSSNTGYFADHMPKKLK